MPAKAAEAAKPVAPEALSAEVEAAPIKTGPVSKTEGAPVSTPSAEASPAAVEPAAEAVPVAGKPVAAPKASVAAKAPDKPKAPAKPKAAAKPTTPKTGA